MAARLITLLHCASSALELPRRRRRMALIALLWLCASSALEIPRRPLLLGPAAAATAQKVNANELPSPLVRILTNPSFVDRRDYRYVTTPSGLISTYCSRARELKPISARTWGSAKGCCSTSMPMGMKSPFTIEESEEVSVSMSVSESPLSMPV